MNELRIRELRHSASFGHPQPYATRREISLTLSISPASATPTAAACIVTSAISVWSVTLRGPRRQGESSAQCCFKRENTRSTDWRVEYSDADRSRRIRR